MPFNVLRCFECKTFQIHPQTKASKWRCKTCNEKQSFFKVFMTGTAPECRHTVQTLNMRQGEVENSWEGTGTRPPSTGTTSQFTGTILQLGNTHAGFCSAGDEQGHETQLAADLGRLQPLSSVRHQQDQARNGSWNSGEVTRLPDLDPRTSRLGTQAPRKKPLAFQAANNRQEESSGGSKWTQFLDPADAADSSSSEDETLRHPTVRSKDHRTQSL